MRISFRWPWATLALCVCIVTYIFWIVYSLIPKKRWEIYRFNTMLRESTRYGTSYLTLFVRMIRKTRRNFWNNASRLSNAIMCVLHVLNFLPEYWPLSGFPTPTPERSSSSLRRMRPRLNFLGLNCARSNRRRGIIPQRMSSWSYPCSVQCRRKGIDYFSLALLPCIIIAHANSTNRHIISSIDYFRLMR